MSTDAIFAVVLAAGASTRFGRTKQLEPFEGVPLATTALRKAEYACGNKTLLVVGNDWQEVVAACEPLEGFFVVNDCYREGLASSIACAVGAVVDSAGGVLLTMADLPLVTAEHLSELLRAWTESPESIIASEFDDTLGPPVIFPRSDFDTLMKLRGDRGARAVIDTNRDRVVAINCEDAAVDIDHPEDLPGIY